MWSLLLWLRAFPIIIIIISIISIIIITTIIIIIITIIIIIITLTHWRPCRPKLAVQDYTA